LKTPARRQSLIGDAVKGDDPWVSAMVAEMYARVSAAGGLVEIDGKSMMYRSIAQRATEEVITEYIEKMRAGLLAAVAGYDESTKRELDAAIDEIARKARKEISERLPVMSS
jgi:hypothetical protein